MSLYAIGREVYVKSLKTTGEIVGAEFRKYGDKRLAYYTVKDKRGIISGTFSRDLTPADWCCDSCDRWRPSSDTPNGPRDCDGYLLVAYCWWCVTKHYRDEGYDPHPNKATRAKRKRYAKKMQELQRQREKEYEENLKKEVTA